MSGSFLPPFSTSRPARAPVSAEVTVAGPSLLACEHGPPWPHQLVGGLVIREEMGFEPAWFPSQALLTAVLLVGGGR